MSPSRDEDARLLEPLIDLALSAGAAALSVYAGDFGFEKKEDASPVTEADRLCEEIILRGLAALAPAIPVLAEESAAEGRIPDLGSVFFLVDPLDGTKEFISRNGEFTVNIALVRDEKPVLGVVYAPAIRRLYAGARSLGALRIDIDEQGAAGPKQAIAARPAPEKGLVAVASRSHRSPETDDFLKTLKIAEFAAAGSSLKFCLIAEGAADVYPRLGRTMEWDTGAGQAVLEAAGGRVEVYPSGEPLRYGKKSRGFDNPHFIAWGAARALP
ncbi:MAG: 3'(2'),5'-bisphosphate nucleotidase CysQ [Alphaproteobacteria bacterium]|nr:3'(2'),5'-bisphosphate nucleotidase CysQ [Alphaproteobacteria bacterium]